MCFRFKKWAVLFFKPYCPLGDYLAITAVPTAVYRSAAFAVGLAAPRSTIVARATEHAATAGVRTWLEICGTERVSCR